MSIVVIDPVSSGITYLAAAQHLGIDLYVFSADEGERQLSHDLRTKAKQVIKIDTTDFESQFVKLSELGQIDAILPGVEYAVPMASRLGAASGKIHLNSNAVQWVRNKFNFRERLTETGLSHISYLQLHVGQEIDVPDNFPFPAIVKPVDMAGSINVRKVNNREELTEAVEAIWCLMPNDVGFTTSGSIIVEEYISGKEYSVEGIVHRDNNITIASITEKILGSEPYFIEIGHIVGRHYDDAFRTVVTDYAQAVIHSIGLNIGAFHLELRVTPEGNPVAIELAARLPGDNIVELIKQANGIDLAAATLCEYLHLNYQIFNHQTPPHSASVSAIAFIPRGQHKFFGSLHGLDEFINRPEYFSHHLYVKPGDTLGCAEDWTSRIGYVMFVSRDEILMRSLVKLVHEKVKIV
ncbi:ATP-grasp domain-containing protein [Xenorhabdus szentirmaii]|uniref:Phosphoribosylglycinamide synthetase ATP-grasp domain-containing protein n=1 Tax=Xenorhabdus szentirmaii DSM 16338 TaxID=1427518 RepID=W1J160_9GAMM|nr:ATP-grasp domain-containing protein [Xenorhabdus szentirmaii]PHM32828.1 Carbamoyl-phosphate synthase small chain [Xenorhabdus szentirmaii DSM 16338]PHM40856.1 Carbamoyl-phosphate synthase small chain [Xenorhabdus szentirmaii]CDL83818.1 Phosphoribosylglycinamide synthetase ATP-grasp domain-containing protein [Xenorhabdus szentirmaii DSM 16338]